MIQDMEDTWLESLGFKRPERLDVKKPGPPYDPAFQVSARNMINNLLLWYKMLESWSNRIGKCYFFSKKQFSKKISTRLRRNMVKISIFISLCERSGPKSNPVLGNFSKFPLSRALNKRF